MFLPNILNQNQNLNSNCWEKGGSSHLRRSGGVNFRHVLWVCCSPQLFLGTACQRTLLTCSFDDDNSWMSFPSNKAMAVLLPTLTKGELDT